MKLKEGRKQGMINPKLVVVTLLILIGGSIIGANNIFA
jgi:hypothetical protein